MYLLIKLNFFKYSQEFVGYLLKPNDELVFTPTNGKTVWNRREALDGACISLAVYDANLVTNTDKQIHITLPRCEVNNVFLLANKETYIVIIRIAATSEWSQS